ncbi:MAG: translation initiation factor IF-2 [Clostridia bacterium]|nr:translation initiation factor IF-2 [Clostridia bacterium]
MRIHELAKEMNVQSSDIIDALKNIDKDKDYKPASGIKDDDIPKVKESLAKNGKYAAAGVAKEVKPEQPKVEQPKVEQPKVEQPKQEYVKQTVSEEKPSANQADRTAPARQDADNRQNRPADNAEKKSRITQVYNPQNSSRGRDNRGGNGGNGQGGYNRDNRGGNGQGGYNRDNRGGNGQGGYNRDNRGGNGQGGFNRDNRGGNGQGGFNRDNRGGNGQGGRRDDRRRETIQDDFTFEQKPDSRRPDSRKNDRNDRKNQKDRDDKENLKFANQKKVAPTKPVEKEETIKNLILPDTLTIKELADKMKVQPSAVVKKLFLQGKVVTINQEIDYDTAEEIALEFNCICDHEVKVDIIAELLKEEDENPETLVARPPVVCVMGHVDHGKTSLLDAIRSTNVTAKESGGITQRIGAYTVEINGQKITFLDTPGHEAFTAMRMRGAQSTDIAILVVAADDGVMPQTVEAINHAKAAGIDIIVAINKIDKPNANIERVKQELTEYELIPEDWGGSTIFCPVSAHTKEGIDNLLEMILLDAEVLELKANPDRKARGLVIEARLDKGKGPVANILVQKGTLHVGDNIAAGSCYGKIRAMTDDKGNKVKSAGPSTPVEVLGLNDVPNAGEIIVATDSDKEARNFAETFIRAGREKLLDDTKAKLSLDDLFSQIQAGNVKELNIIVKADVQGSVEAVKSSLLKLSNEEVVVKIIHGGVGNINESDVTLASASNAIIIGFNVKPDNQAHIVADREKVDVRLYKVIYNAIEDVEAALKGMLEPKYEEKVTGKIVVRQTYKASGVGVIAGSYVIDGYVTRNASVRLKRGDEELYDGPIASLKRFKDDVKEVKEGFECGIVLEKFNDIQEDDVMEAYEMVEIPR